MLIDKNVLRIDWVQGAGLGLGMTQVEGKTLPEVPRLQPPRVGGSGP